MSSVSRQDGQAAGVTAVMASPRPTRYVPRSQAFSTCRDSARPEARCSSNSLSMVSSCSRYGDRHRRGGASTACLSPTKQLDAYEALSGALAVILGFVAEAKHVVLIHGSWSRGEQLAPARTAFEQRGYTAHTPTLRYHELPMQEGAMKVASLSLRDYADDLVALVNSLDSPPLLIGHSMGGLLAQLVAARTRQAGLVAACPGPAAGILGGTRTTLRMSLPHLLRPRSWTKPWRPPTFEQSRRWIANTQTEDIAREMYDGLVCESGRYLWELLLAVPKLSKATVVDFAAVTAPVLVVGAECDRIVSAGVVRRTAGRYQHGTSVEIPRSDHMVFSGAALPVTMSYIDDWMARNHVLAADAAN